MSTVTNYPIPSTTFKLAGGIWEPHFTGERHCRMMRFESTIEDSAINRFYVHGYRDGKVSITIWLGGSERANELFKDFLKANQVPAYPNCYVILAETPEHLQKVWEILSGNNKIPDPYFDKITSLVTTGCPPWHFTDEQRDANRLAGLEDLNMP